MIATFAAFMARCITGAGVRWVGCEPSERQRIYFANHTSHLDALVLWAALPSHVRSRTRPVAARDYWAAGVRRLLATRVFHAVLIDRQRVSAHANPIEPLLEALDQHASLIIFPEGGRQLSGEVAPFKSGLFHLAHKRPAVELVPVHIDNANRILPKGEIVPVPFLCCLSFGAPMHLLDGETKPAFLERARAAVLALRGPDG
ncbi:MAG: lysophospholipid acyltransferase family protein [Planctomycetota bacterium]